MKDASTGIGLEAAAVKVDGFRAATGVLTAVVAGVLAWLLELWPPHEDEALAPFVGRGSRRASPRALRRTRLARRRPAHRHRRARRRAAALPAGVDGRPPRRRVDGPAPRLP